MRKVIITAAQTGGFHGKEANPNLPEQPEEIARSTFECWKAGAAVAHIHARDAHGKPTGDPKIYSHIFKLIREKYQCDIVLGVTTGVGPGSTIEERIRSIETDPPPEMASLNMGTMVRTRWGDGTIFLNARSQIESFAKAMLERGVKPEMEVYSHAMMRDVENLIEKDLVKKPYCINFVLGMTHQGALAATVKDLLSVNQYLIRDAVFLVTAIGAGQLPLTTLSVLLGGHLRVGMEDNVYYAKGLLAESNAQFVSRSTRILKELQFEIATPDDAREILGLRKL